MRPFKEANSLPEHKLDLNVHYTIQINIKNEKNRRQLLHKLFLSILKQLFKVKKHHNVVINLWNKVLLWHETLAIKVLSRIIYL